MKKEFVEKEYQNTIETYVQKAYLSKVPETEAPPPEIRYLPNFPIVKMSKFTTKVRIVFDCSARCNGVSLNDVIRAGPKLQRELFDVLIHFRHNPVALDCDIQEMYLQIEIEAEDQPLFEFSGEMEKRTAIQMCMSSAELSLEKTQPPCKPSLLCRSMRGITKLNIHYMLKQCFTLLIWTLHWTGSQQGTYRLKQLNFETGVMTETILLKVFELFT